MWLLDLIQGFSKIWPSDLVFHPSWPIFKLVRDIIKANILSNFQEYWTENMASRAYTMFFLDLTWWPSFWPNMAHFHTIQDIIKTNILTIFQDYWTENVASIVYKRFF